MVDGGGGGGGGGAGGASGGWGVAVGSARSDQLEAKTHTIPPPDELTGEEEGDTGDKQTVRYKLRQWNGDTPQVWTPKRWARVISEV